MLEERLQSARLLHVRQRRELLELLGAETRNKYEILDQTENVIGFAAEQGKGLGAMLGRYFLGHWRQYEIFVFDSERKPVLRLNHPFRWLFARVDVFNAMGARLGAIQKRFSILQKRFDFEDAAGGVLFEVSSPIWKPWTFPILKRGAQVAVVRKKWSGLLKESLLDADNFVLEFESPQLTKNEKCLMLAAALFVDLEYFEKKANDR